jgi:F0F1-type ATP synthase delta subunit
MEHAYAQALQRAVENGMTPHAAVKRIKELLGNEGRLGLLPRVARAFAHLSERERSRNDVVLTVAREKDERGAKGEVRDILGSLKADADSLRTQVDDSLIGGWRLEGRGTLVDRSHKAQLLDIYHRVTRA